MINKTLDKEIPVTEEGLQLFIKAISKELDFKNSAVKRLKLALKKAQERLEKR